MLPLHSHNLIGFMGREALERTQPFGRGKFRSYQKMNMVGHDYPGVQRIPSKSLLAIKYRLFHKNCDRRYFQVKRTG